MTTPQEPPLQLPIEMIRKYLKNNSDELCDEHWKDDQRFRLQKCYEIAISKMGPRLDGSLMWHTVLGDDGDIDHVDGIVKPVSARNWEVGVNLKGEFTAFDKPPREIPWLSSAR